MAAGTAYGKRYAGGFVDGSGGGTPIDSVFLNAVETALLQLIGAAPTVDGQVAQWDTANTRFGPALLLNKNVDPAAAIAKSKLDFTGANGIVNADIAGAAAIAYSKLNLTGQILNADLAGSIATSKIAGYLPGATILRKNTPKAVNTTVAATDLLNGEITIPAMTATQFLRVTLSGDWINNVGTAQVPPRFQVVLGATTLLDTGVTTTTYNADATRREWKIDLLISPSNATNAQYSFMRLVMALGTQAIGAANWSFTTGHGGGIPTSLQTAIADGGNQTAVDMSVSNLLKLNVINGNAGAAYETKLLSALAEIL